MSKTLVEVGGRDARFSIIPYHESVTAGHPDLACNIAADHFLDEAIRASKGYLAHPRVALEVTAKGGIPNQGENLSQFSPEMKKYIQNHGLVFVTGEVTLPSGVQIPTAGTIAKGFQSAGYRDPNYSFYPTVENILVAVNSQSKEIGGDVDDGGAGDQGGMVGFATDESGVFMPLSTLIARRLTQRQFELFESGAFHASIKPDGKSQITLKQRLHGDRVETLGIHNLTVAVSHDPLLPLRELKKILQTEQIEPVLEEFKLSLDADSQVVINGAGEWTVYGPTADAGTTNRKLMVQAVGLSSKHGGGGWSGKDPTKVDRSGAYFARHIALSLVAGDIASQCEVAVSYTIGIGTPHVIRVNTFGTNKAGRTDSEISELVQKNFSWTVPEMIEKLNLWQPIYARSNMNGAFGTPEYPWEKPTELR